MKISAIGWTDYSGGDLNFATGCTPVSEGCHSCYARRIYERFGRDFSQVTFHEDKLRRLSRMRLPQYSPKRGAPYRPMCFVVETGDLFHEALASEHIQLALSELALWRHIIWQVLTKRPERMAREVRYWCDSRRVKTMPSNVWLGVTAENQRRADERIPLLLDTPAAVRFVSVEPMLEPVDLSVAIFGDSSAEMTGMNAISFIDGYGYGLDWVICGAESGPNRRPFDPQWAVDLYEQCREAGVKFFGKQDSAFRPGEPLMLGDYGVVQEWPQ